MSNEIEKTTEVCNSKFSVFIKEAISVVIGAVIAFAVTFGVVTTDQDAKTKNKIKTINTSATEVVELLKKGDVANALVKANKIVEETNTNKKVVAPENKVVKNELEKTKEKKIEETKKVNVVEKKVVKDVKKKVEKAKKQNKKADQNKKSTVEKK